MVKALDATDNYKTTISGKGLAAGVYLLKVSDGKQEHSIKLIKEIMLVDFAQNQIIKI